MVWSSPPFRASVSLLRAPPDAPLPQPAEGCFLRLAAARSSPSFDAFVVGATRPARFQPHAGSLLRTAARLLLFLLLCRNIGLELRAPSAIRRSASSSGAPGPLSASASLFLCPLLPLPALSAPPAPEPSVPPRLPLGAFLASSACRNSESVASSRRRLL